MPPYHTSSGGSYGSEGASGGGGLYPPRNGSTTTTRSIHPSLDGVSFLRIDPNDPEAASRRFSSSFASAPAPPPPGPVSRFLDEKKDHMTRAERRQEKQRKSSKRRSGKKHHSGGGGVNGALAHHNHGGGNQRHRQSHRVRRTDDIAIIDVVPDDHPSSDTIQTTRTCTLCRRTLPRDQFSSYTSDGLASSIHLSLAPGAVCRTCGITVAATRCKSAGYAVKTPSNVLLLTNGDAGPLANEGGTSAVAMGGPRNDNVAHCRYLDELMGHDDFPRMAQLSLFTSARDMTVSSAALNAARSHGSLDLIQKNPRGVLCLCLGDGLTPRTAVLAALTRHWTVVAIDPELGDHWEGYRDDVDGYTGYTGTLRDFMDPGGDCGCEEALIEAANNDVRRLVILCVGNVTKINTVRFRNSTSMGELRKRYHNVPTTVVSVSPIHRPTLAPDGGASKSKSKLRKDLGREPDARYEDDAVFSEVRQVEVWNFAAGATVTKTKAAKKKSLREQRQQALPRAAANAEGIAHGGRARLGMEREEQVGRRSQRGRESIESSAHAAAAIPQQPASTRTNGPYWAGEDAPTPLVSSSSAFATAEASATASAAAADFDPYGLHRQEQQQETKHPFSFSSSPPQRAELKEDEEEGTDDEEREWNNHNSSPFSSLSQLQEQGHNIQPPQQQQRRSSRAAASSIADAAVPVRQDARTSIPYDDDDDDVGLDYDRALSMEEAEGSDDEREWKLDANGGSGNNVTRAQQHQLYQQRSVGVVSPPPPPEEEEDANYEPNDEHEPEFALGEREGLSSIRQPTTPCHDDEGSHDEPEHGHGKPTSINRNLPHDQQQELHDELEYYLEGPNPDEASGQDDGEEEEDDREWQVDVSSAPPAPVPPRHDEKEEEEESTHHYSRSGVNDEETSNHKGDDDDAVEGRALPNGHRNLYEDDFSEDGKGGDAVLRRNDHHHPEEQKLEESDDEGDWRIDDDDGDESFNEIEDATKLLNNWNERQWKVDAAQSSAAAAASDQPSAGAAPATQRRAGGKNRTEMEDNGETHDALGANWDESGGDFNDVEDATKLLDSWNERQWKVDAAQSSPSATAAAPVQSSAIPAPTRQRTGDDEGRTKVVDGADARQAVGISWDESSDDGSEGGNFNVSSGILSGGLDNIDVALDNLLWDSDDDDEPPVLNEASPKQAGVSAAGGDERMFGREDDGQYSLNDDDSMEDLT